MRMKPVVSIGNQDFKSIRENGFFYVDKTDFIREWWESYDIATLVTRPRRFGKTLRLSDKYHIISNRESGFGRYDVMMEPLEDSLPAFVLEFKVINPSREKSLEETVESALLQIDEKNYDTELLSRGIIKERIKHYGFAFEGKNVLIR